MECRISDQIAAEAGRWDARLRAPDCSEDDRARFAEWRDADPERRLAFERAQEIVTIFRDNRARADIRALRDAALFASRRHRRGRRLWAALAAGVAAVAVAAIVWTALPEHAWHASLQQLIASIDTLLARSHLAIHATDVGERATVTLADGSIVELNSKTRIEVAFSRHTRSVELIEGQALFQVARNSRRPFVVRAADRAVTAVGTAFDVRLDATSVRVTLLDGKVTIQDAASKAESSAPPRRETQLVPGQQFVARLAGADASDDGGASPASNVVTGSGTVRTIDVTKVTAWRDGRIFLEDLTLAEALTEMNKHSRIQIRIGDPALAQVRVNGMFRAGRQQAFVTALEQYFPITARRENDATIVLVRKL